MRKQTEPRSDGSMLTRVSCVARPTVVVAVTVLLAGSTAAVPQTQPPAAAQESASAPLAQQLAAALDGAQLDSIAAKDTEGDDRYVAALFFPGRLLVVSARYEVPLYADTGGRLVRFSEDWSGQALSQAEYTTLFSEADAGSRACFGRCWPR